MHLALRIFSKKLEVISETSTASEIDSLQGRLFIKDKYSNLYFLIDTGADISVIPPDKKFKNCSNKNNLQLYAANGSIINMV